MLRHSLRGCADWKEFGLTIKSTTNDETAKLYDCALNQLGGLYDDQNYGGIVKTFNDMTNSDPNFVLGQSLDLALEFGYQAQRSDELKKKMSDLEQLVDKNRDSYELREVKHVEAVKHLFGGNVKKASQLWEEILCEYPTDFHALWISHRYYFDFGFQKLMRDSIARIIPHWVGKGFPYEGYVHGMYAFGLEETNLFSRAESEAKLALHFNSMDGWATHAIAHIYETREMSETGIKFMNESEDNWSKSNLLACHNYWHLALQHILESDYERALHIFDNHIIEMAKSSPRGGNIKDATSLLFRLSLKEPNMDLEIDHRWQEVYGLAKPHIPNEYMTGFYDCHLLMACLGSKHSDSVEQIVDKVKGYDSNEEWLTTTRAIVSALVEYYRENYSKCVDLLFDVKNNTQCMGGSNAQRDVFNKVLISAALKSSKEWHKKLAINLMNEKNSFQ